MELRQRIRNFLESFDFYFRIRFSDFFLKYIQKKHFSVAPTLQLEKEYYLSFLKNIKGDKKIFISFNFKSTFEGIPELCSLFSNFA